MRCTSSRGVPFSIHRTGRGGDRRAMTVIEAPGSFGEIGLIDGGRRSASAEALEATDLFALPRSEFLRLLAEEPKLVQGVLRECGRLIRRLTEQLADTTMLDLPARVAKTLVRLVEVRRSADPEALPVISLSQGKVAELAGGSRQSVNGALSTLAQRGLIRIDGRRIIVVDLPGLRARAAGDAGALAVRWTSTLKRERATRAGSVPRTDAVLADPRLVAARSGSVATP